MTRYLVIFEKTLTGYSAYLPDLPGCVSTGNTKDICEANIAEALELHLEGMRAEGLPIPSPISESEVLVLRA